MKTIITFLALLLTGQIAFAQQHNTYSPTPTLKKQPANSLTQPGTGQRTEPLNAFNSPVSVQILAGSQGVGADVRYGILPKLSGRLGFGIVPVDADKAFQLASFPVNGQLAARFANVHLMADYALFKTNIIRLVGGAAYLIRGNANVLISSTNGYSLGSRNISAGQLGVVNAGVSWRGIAPYAGLSVFSPFPSHRFNVNLDLGTYYLSRPGTTFTGTNLLSDNESSARQFNDNMKGYRWMPVVQLNFNVKIK